MGKKLQTQSTNVQCKREHVGVHILFILFFHKFKLNLAFLLADIKFQISSVTQGKSSTEITNKKHIKMETHSIPKTRFA